eukprot:1430681-Pleurochrysis_carterae.AAC.1
MLAHPRFAYIENSVCNAQQRCAETSADWHFKCFDTCVAITASSTHAFASALKLKPMWPAAISWQSRLAQLCGRCAACRLLRCDCPWSTRRHTVVIQ